MLSLVEVVAIGGEISLISDEQCGMFLAKEQKSLRHYWQNESTKVQSLAAIVNKQTQIL